MSYKATNWAYELALKAPAKPVLVALADMADEAHSCFPSQRRLAMMTGFDERTVRRAISTLEAAELVRRERRHDGQGRRTSDRFVLALGSVLPVTVTTGQSDHRSESPRLPDTQSAPTGHSDLGTISEPSENHQQGASRSKGHKHEPNAQSAINRLCSERALPIDGAELLEHAYRLGSGDPWAGYLTIKQITETSLVGANSPVAVLRKRLRDVA